MKRFLMTFLAALGMWLCAWAQSDIIVLNDGTVLNVTSLDYSPADKCYYTLDADKEQLKSVAKTDIIIIKLADGTKIDPNATMAPSRETTNRNNRNSSQLAKEAVTFNAVEENFTEKQTDWNKDLKGYIFYSRYKKQGGKKDICTEKYVMAHDEKGHLLNMRLLSEADKTLAVARPPKVEEVNKKGKVKVKDGKYGNSDIIIPNYVMVGNDRYTVTEVDPAAFISHGNITSVDFPETLRSIDAGAFWGCNLKRIVLPESLEKIGLGAFYASGDKMFEQLYIPKNVKDIGMAAFHFLGSNTSYRGYFQGTLTCLPDFVSTGNCKDYGIDEEAVEAYLRRR